MTRTARSLRRALLALFAGGLAAVCPIDICRADDALDQFKAVYLFNFAKLTTWPTSAPADVLTMCFIGASGVRDQIAHDVAGKSIGTRRVAVRAVDPAQRADCNVLYIDAAATTDARAVSNMPSYALTVSDAHDFMRRGGMIELFAQGNRLRFNINLDTARLAGLKMSSSLLNLASNVEQMTP
ncbi:MAG: hypothetical protein QOI88_703 [Gammaproteobacteria bacterium]|nr:hypothetical protein [Gammaproteobacteria bacterium]